MNDPRQNLPSASGLSRLKACPGSFALEQTVPREEKNDPDAEHGTIIHDALAGELKGEQELTPQQSETVEMCEGIVQKVLGSLGFGSIARTFNHRRFWLMDYRHDKIQPVFSGEVDRLVANKGAELVIFDFKTLFGEHEQAPDNLQLMALAVLAAEHFTAVNVAVCLIQPWKAGQFTLASYDNDALDKARAELGRILESAAQPNAPRIAGPQCKFCRAQFKCPEAQGQMMALKVMTDTALTEGHQLAAFWDVWQVIKSRGDKLEQLIKTRLSEDSASVPGLALKPGVERRTIVDTSKAYLAIKDTVPAERFAACCKVTIGELEEEYRKASEAAGNKLTQKEAKVVLDLRLGHSMEKKRTQPSIVKVKQSPDFASAVLAGENADMAC